MSGSRTNPPAHRLTTTWNGSTDRPTKDDVQDRYTLTLAGFVATLPRGACGHLICAGRDRCAWEGER